MNADSDLRRALQEEARSIEGEQCIPCAISFTEHTATGKLDSSSEPHVEVVMARRRNSPAWRELTEAESDDPGKVILKKLLCLFDNDDNNDDKVRSLCEGTSFTSDDFNMKNEEVNKTAHLNSVCSADVKINERNTNMKGWAIDDVINNGIISSDNCTNDNQCSETSKRTNTGGTSLSQIVGKDNQDTNGNTHVSTDDVLQCSQCLSGRCCGSKETNLTSQLDCTPSAEETSNLDSVELATKTPGEYFSINSNFSVEHNFLSISAPNLTNIPLATLRTDKTIDNIYNSDRADFVQRSNSSTARHFCDEDGIEHPCNVESMDNSNETNDVSFEEHQQENQGYIKDIPEMNLASEVNAYTCTSCERHSKNIEQDKLDCKQLCKPELNYHITDEKDVDKTLHLQERAMQSQDNIKRNMFQCTRACSSMPSISERSNIHTKSLFSPTTCGSDNILYTNSRRFSRQRSISPLVPMCEGPYLIKQSPLASVCGGKQQTSFIKRNTPSSPNTQPIAEEVEQRNDLRTVICSGDRQSPVRYVISNNAPFFEEESSNETSTEAPISTQDDNELSKINHDVRNAFLDDASVQKGYSPQVVNVYNVYPSNHNLPELPKTIRSAIDNYAQQWSDVGLMGPSLRLSNSIRKLLERVGYDENTVDEKLRCVSSSKLQSTAQRHPIAQRVTVSDMGLPYGRDDPTTLAHNLIHETTQSECTDKQTERSEHIANFVQEQTKMDVKPLFEDVVTSGDQLSKSQTTIRRNPAIKKWLAEAARSYAINDELGAGKHPAVESRISNKTLSNIENTDKNIASNTIQHDVVDLCDKKDSGKHKRHLNHRLCWKHRERKSYIGHLKGVKSIFISQCPSCLSKCHNDDEWYNDGRKVNDNDAVDADMPSSEKDATSEAVRSVINRKTRSTAVFYDGRNELNSGKNSISARKYGSSLLDRLMICPSKEVLKNKPAGNQSVNTCDKHPPSCLHQPRHMARVRSLHEDDAWRDSQHSCTSCSQSNPALTKQLHNITSRKANN